MECSENVINQFKAKHPDPHSSAHLPQAPDEAICLGSVLVTSENVHKCIFSFKSGFSAGPDGLAPQRLKDL